MLHCWRIRTKHVRASGDVRAVRHFLPANITLYVMGHELRVGRAETGVVRLLLCLRGRREKKKREREMGNTNGGKTESKCRRRRTVVGLPYLQFVAPHLSISLDRCSCLLLHYVPTFHSTALGQFTQSAARVQTSPARFGRLHFLVPSNQYRTAAIEEVMQA